MEFCQTDSQALLVQIRRHEALLKSKRRWLLGLPTSESRRKYPDHSDFLNKQNLPESLLREDDIFYETVKTRVEEAFGALGVETRHLGIRADQIFDSCKIGKLILSCLNDLSTRGLYLLAVVLTENSAQLEKTRCKLKRTIREFIPKVLRSKSQDCRQLEIVKQLAQLLNDSKNFRRRRSTTLTSSLFSNHDAVSHVLYGLGDLPTQVLLAMHRKLVGVRFMPQMKRNRHGRGRDCLINLLTKISKKMLSSIGEGDELQESLAKAMAVADLSLKLVPGRHNSSIIEFYHFSPQMKSLHNEIVKAIWSISKRVNFQKLKQVKSLLDPNAKVSHRSLRSCIKRMLIDYLFECSDMDTVPKSLLKALALINADSQIATHSVFSQDEIEEEVECVFSLSAQMKQVVWDLLPNCDFEHDFADAYMEELEESDNDLDDHDEDSCDGLPREDNESRSVYVEGMGESMPANLDHSSVGNILSPSYNADVESFQYSTPMHFKREGSLDSSFSYHPSFMESKGQHDAYNLSSTDAQLTTERHSFLLSSVSRSSAARMPSPSILPITQPPSSSPFSSGGSVTNSIMATTSTAIDIMLLKEDDEHRTGLLVSPLFDDDRSIGHKPLLPRTSSYASSTSTSSSGSTMYKQKRRRVKSEEFLSFLSGDGRHQTFDHDVENADVERAERFLLTRLGLKLSKYIRVAFRWIARFLALGCYSFFLLPGFLQVGYYYFSSSQIRRSIPYGDKPRNKLDLYLPKHIDGPKPVVAFITGGAWIIGYKAWGCLLGQQLSERDVIVACIDYRNFPQGTMSDMIDDASQGISFLCNNIREFGGDPNRIYLMGQSAGAHIAACTLLEHAMKEVRKVESISWSVSQIKAYFGLSGGYNLLNLVDYFHSRGLSRSLFLSIMEGEQSLKRFSPEVMILEEPNIGAAVSILPPIILFHGTADYSIPSDASKTFAETLQSVGVKTETFFYEGKTHTDVFVQDPLRGGRDQMFEDLVGIIHANDAEALAKDAVAPPRRRFVPEIMLMLARSVSPF